MSSSELHPSSDSNKHPGGGDTSEKFYSAHGITPSESSNDIITRLQKLEEQHTELQEKYKELHTTVENISTTTTSRRLEIYFNDSKSTGTEALIESYIYIYISIK